MDKNVKKTKKVKGAKKIGAFRKVLICLLLTASVVLFGTDAIKINSEDETLYEQFSGMGDTMGEIGDMLEGVVELREEVAMELAELNEEDLEEDEDWEDDEDLDEEEDEDWEDEEDEDIDEEEDEEWEDEEEDEDWEEIEIEEWEEDEEEEEWEIEWRTQCEALLAATSGYEKTRSWINGRRLGLFGTLMATWNARTTLGQLKGVGEDFVYWDAEELETGRKMLSIVFLSGCLILFLAAMFYIMGVIGVIKGKRGPLAYTLFALLVFGGFFALMCKLNYEFLGTLFTDDPEYGLAIHIPYFGMIASAQLAMILWLPGGRKTVAETAAEAGTEEKPAEKLLSIPEDDDFPIDVFGEREAKAEEKAGEALKEEAAEPENKPQDKAIEEAVKTEEAAALKAAAKTEQAAEMAAKAAAEEALVEAESAPAVQAPETEAAESVEKAAEAPEASEGAEKTEVAAEMAALAAAEEAREEADD
ncbi:MAG: hypothetical protein IK115_10340 [Lachnospiraceae bacterium]|nr:hypothetical protein [Lachnospiraceae bacterium]